MMHSTTNSEDEVSQPLLLPPHSKDVNVVEGAHAMESSVRNNNEDTKMLNRFATAEQRRRRATYDAVQESVHEMMLQRFQQKEMQEQKNRRRNAKRIVQNGLRSARDMIQKINIGRWIDELEHDQQVANELDRINQDRMEEEERQQLVQKVHAMCMDAIRDHLSSFLLEHNEQHDGTYEEWIAELHPENVIIPNNNNSISIIHNNNTTTTPNNHSDSCGETTNSIPSTVIQIDPRFYVADSDHLRLWHEMHHSNTVLQQNDQTM